MSSIVIEFERLEKLKAELQRSAEALAERARTEFPRDPRPARAIAEFPHGVYSPVSELAGCPVYFDYPTLGSDVKKLLYSLGVKA